MAFLRHLSLPLCAIMAFGCGGELLIPGEEQPAEQQPAPSAGVSTIAAAPVSIEAVTGSSSIVVTVLGENGEPVEGATVTLHATGAGNTVLQPSELTNADGVATGTLSSTVPGVKVVSAVINGEVEMSQTAEVTVTAAGATTITPIAGTNGQTGRVSQELAVQPAVRVTNALGEPVAGYEVTFAVTAGGGSVDAVTVRTDSEGIARVRWVLGATPGANMLEARAPALAGSPVVFTAQGTSDDSGTGGGTGGGGTGGGGTGGGGTGGGGTGGGGTGGGGTGGGGTGGGGTGGGGTGGGGTGGGGTGGGGPSASDIDRLVYTVAPPTEVDDYETFTVQVALVDANGNVVPMSGVFVYLDLIREGETGSSRPLLGGEHFENTENGVAVFDILVKEEGLWRLRALTDDLPELGPHGPEPWLFSNVFEVD